MPSKDEMIAEQRRLATLVVRHDDVSAIRCVAGIDVAYDDDNGHMVAAAVTLDVATLAVAEIKVVHGTPSVPYHPGLFSFRELPIVLEALGRLTRTPDLVVCDGHGIAHPRRLGLASHLGVVTGIPTIGCAKSRLIGDHDTPAAQRGSHSPLYDSGEVVGAVLRTQADIRPLYVSIGHRIALDTACDWILRLSPRYRLPETTRAADHAVRLARAEG